MNYLPGCSLRCGVQVETIAYKTCFPGTIYSVT